MRRFAAAAFAVFGLSSHVALAQGGSPEPIRLALVEAMSGPFASSGAFMQRNLQFAIERVNARGGVKLPGGARPLQLDIYDNQGRAEEALNGLRAALDRNTVFVMQGASSSVAAALSESIARHNERDPGRQALFLNYAAVDPVLTEARCNPWHFRFDAHVGMRMAALTGVLQEDRSVQRVFLLNQDYSFGHALARSAREQLAQRRPDVAVVGEVFHPIGKVRDFAPYISQIAASRADAVITGNWGPDLALLVKAARDAGLQARFYTFYANSLGAPAAIGEAGVGRTLAVAEWHPNAGNAAMEAVHAAFRERFPRPQDDYLNARNVFMIEMLVRAIEQAGEVRAEPVARRLSGMHYRDLGADMLMRPQDHQVIMPLYVFTMQRQGSQGARFDQEGSGFGFVTARRLEAAQVAPPVACSMPRWQP